MGETSGRIDDESLPLTGALGQLMATCMMPVYGKPYLINTPIILLQLGQIILASAAAVTQSVQPFDTVSALPAEMHARCG